MLLYQGISRGQFMIGVASIVSALSCLSIIVTYMKFPMLHKQAYLKLILYISICDFVASVMFIATYKDRSFMCWVQGIFLNYFQLASTLWVDVTIWHLFRTVVMGKSIKNHKVYHFLCWGLPFLYIVLSLATNDYGVSSGEEYGYCWVVDRPNTPTWTTSMWEIVFFTIIWFSNIFIIVLIGTIIYKTRLAGTTLMKPYIKKALKKLISYPVILIFCYSVVSYRFMVDIADPSSDNYSPGLTVFSDIILSLQGFFTAIVFWIGNKSIARLWDYSKWYCCLCSLFSFCCDFSGVTPFGQEPQSTPDCGIVRTLLVEPLLNNSESTCCDHNSKLRASSLTKFDFPHNDATKLSEEETSSASSTNNYPRTVSRDNPLLDSRVPVVIGQARLSENFLSDDTHIV